MGAFLAALPAITQLAGTGLQAWGGMSAAEEQRRQFEAQMLAYREQMERQAKADENALQQEFLTNMMDYGDFAQKTAETNRQRWNPYARQIGL